MSRPIALAVLAGLSLSLSSAAIAQPPAAPAPAQPAGGGAKKPVKTADDLPRHTYQIEGKASEFLLSDKPFKEFLTKVEADAKADLAEYDIKDPTTLQGYHGLLMQAAMIEGRWDDALAQIDKIRALEQKESKKLMTGQALTAMVDARKAAGKDAAKFDAAFKANLKKSVGALPWETVREEVTQAKGRAEYISRDLILGQIQAALDPVVAASEGEISSDLARGLVGARATLDVMLPIMAPMGEVYSEIIESHKTAAAPSIWPERNVTLTEADKGSPVVVAVWDSGVDTTLFPKQLWTNPKETVNGKDDDGNGYIDDVHGIGYDLDSKPVVDLLCPVTDLKNEKSLVTAHTKGLGDTQSGIDSPEAAALKKYLKNLKSDQVKDFLEDLGLFGNYSHGTHVAGIAADGNPFIRIMPVRITFDYRTIPLHTPTLERAQADAKAAKDCVNYMKAAGVRVVNMSWGGSRQSIEEELERKNWGTPEERADLARKLFKIQKDALEEAFKSAPEILFVAAAGNSDANNEFSEFVPSGINLPNLITIGAVDQAGKPTGFTSFGKNVHLYANGFEVESYIPGGQKLKYNGTSMASPQVANLAAKVLAVNPKFTTAQVIDLITKGGDPMPGSKDGAVRLLINPKKTLELAKAAK